MDVIHEENFDSDTCVGLKPVSLLQCWRDVISETKTFHWTACSTEDMGHCSFDGVTGGEDIAGVEEARDDQALNKNTLCPHI